MKRRYLLVAAPLLGVAIGALVYPRHAEPPARNGRSAAAQPGPAGEASEPDERDPRPGVPLAAAPQAVPARMEANAPASTAPRKPPTASRDALAQSTVPVVASLSIDRLGSPRERLLAATRHMPSEERTAQLDRLGERTRARLERLEERREAATGAEREELDRTIALLERNQSFRDRIGAPTVHDDARPGTERSSR